VAGRRVGYAEPDRRRGTMVPCRMCGMTRLVYRFGGGVSDGEAGNKELLGGKGANLAEMASIGKALALRAL
jgi:hypothetical protein